MSINPKIKFLLKALLYSVWLPLSIILIAFVRIYVLHPESYALAANVFPPPKEITFLFLMTTPSAVPVTIALQLIYRRARKTAFVVGAFTVPLAGIAGLIGGLLGPIGIFLYIQVAGLPAWITLGILALIRKFRNRAKG